MVAGPRNHPNVPCSGEASNQVPVTFTDVAPIAIFLSRGHFHKIDVTSQFRASSCNIRGEKSRKRREARDGKLSQFLSASAGCVLLKASRNAGRSFCSISSIKQTTFGCR